LNLSTKYRMVDLAGISTPVNFCWNSLQHTRAESLFYITVIDENALFYCKLMYSTILNTNLHSAWKCESLKTE
jgi:hypothetical protein